MIRKNKGFTLVELAIVLVIIGLIVGSFIGTISSRIDVSRITETSKELEDIKTAIFGYVYKNRVLPCPDINGDGLSNIVCADSGAIPFVTLGLGSGDAWSNRYEYWIDSAAFGSPFNLDTNTTPTNSGTIKKRSNDGVTLDDLAKNAVAIIFSRGKNELGATGVNGSAKPTIPGIGHDDEVENGNDDNVFVSRPKTDVGASIAGGEFDDILIWISEFELKAKMVEAGRLP